MSLQNELLAKLLTVRDGNLNVSLVSSFQHECIGLPDELHIFLPDIHLITGERQAEVDFGCSTNYEDLLTDLVRQLKSFKVAKGGLPVTVHQLGDLLDLWRQAPQLDQSQDLGAWIANDHQNLMSALLDNELDMQFLLGNHDFNLCRCPNFDGWRSNVYLKNPAGTATAIALHGHVFDWEQDALNTLPEPVKDALVCLSAPIWPPGTRQLGELIALNSQARQRMPNLNQYIQAPKPVALGRTVSAGGEVPARFNVQTETDHLQDGMKYVDAARALCQTANQKYGTKLNMVVIGHTHHARIAVAEDGEGSFVLVDAGAWIEQYLTPESEQPFKNAQIAAVGGNQARIYQLQPR